MSVEIKDTPLKVSEEWRAAIGVIEERFLRFLKTEPGRQGYGDRERTEALEKRRSLIDGQETSLKSTSASAQKNGEEEEEEGDLGMQREVKEKSDENQNEKRCDLFKVMVCGGKNLGKSSFLRVLIRQLGNQRREIKSKATSIYYFDVDVGCPEFTPSGIVSLHQAKLSALRRQLSATEVMDGLSDLDAFQLLDWSYLGDNSPRENPDVFLQKVRSLLCRWLHREEAKNEETISLDPTAMVVINLFGWVTGLGAMLTQQLIDMLDPTLILHFNDSSSEFSDQVKFPSKYAYTEPSCLKESRPSMTLQKQEHASHPYLTLKMTPAVSGISFVPARDTRWRKLMVYFMSGHRRYLPPQRRWSMPLEMMEYSFRRWIMETEPHVAACANLSIVDVGQKTLSGLSAPFLYAALTGQVVGLLETQEQKEQEEMLFHGLGLIKTAYYDTSSNSYSICIVTSKRCTKLADVNTLVLGTERFRILGLFPEMDERPLKLVASKRPS